MTPMPAAVAILTTFYPPVVGGVETAAERLAAYLARGGHRVLVVTKRTDASHPAFEVREGVEIHRTPPVGGRRASGKWLALPWFFLALLRHRRRFDVVCCVDYRGIGLAALAARPLVGRKVLFQTSTDGTISGAAVRRGLGRLGLAPDGRMADALTWPIRAAYGRADRFACVSSAIEAEVLRSGVPRDRVMYLPHSVDTSLFAPAAPDERAASRDALGLPAGGVVAVFVGRLSREKGVMDLLEAWRSMDVPGARLVLIGPDMPGHPWDAGAPARAFVAGNRLQESVRFTGSLPPVEVARWLRAADVAVQPSHFEAFGISAAEAMAAGLPVVASDVGGLKDFVENDVNGVRVPPQDAAALREALRRLLSDAALRARLGAAALDTSRRFDEGTALEGVARALEELAGSTPRTSR